MITLHFTKNSVAKLIPPTTGRSYYHDRRTRGLYLCVYPSGAKVFQYVKKLHGRVVRITLGRFSDITVAMAKAEAVKLAGDIARGQDPGEQRRKVRTETTLGEVFGRYIEMHAKPHKKSWQDDQKQFDRYLTAWQGRKLSQVRRADVAAIHAKIGKKHGRYAANRLLALLSTVFTFAASQGHDGANPAKGIRHFKEQSRDRFLNAGELRAFFAALNDHETPTIWVDFFSIALLTGARRANVLEMSWPALDLDRGIWRISETDSKNAQPLICVLPPAAIEILRQRQATSKSAFVFPGRGKSGHIIAPGKAWQRLVKRAGLNNLRIHDLRRTLGSWQAAAGASLSIIGKSLGHKNLATTAIYARLDLKPVRESVNAAATAMLEAGHDVKALPGPSQNRPVKER